MLLIATSEESTIRYEAAVSFFPHQDDVDFAVSYDAMAEETLYDAKGRRSNKRDEALLKELPAAADRLAQSLGGAIDWENPLREARYG